jgi:hypothetical protein
LTASATASRWTGDNRWARGEACRGGVHGVQCSQVMMQSSDASDIVIYIVDCSGAVAVQQAEQTR